MIDVPRETRIRLDRLAAIVLDESSRQNLISASTVSEIETRHLADSMQLVPLLNAGPILDIGSGAGFPGLVLACCDPARTCHLIESRTKRADFLREAADRLDLPAVHVWSCRVERVELPPVATITARAVASLDKLFAMAGHLADLDTKWVLPKGRSVQSELEAARRTWQGDFELVPSQTDPDSAIVVASRIRRRR